MELNIKTDDQQDSQAVSIFAKLNSLASIADKLGKNIDFLNQEIAFIQEKLTSGGVLPSRYSTTWIFDPRLPYYAEGFGMREMNETENDDVEQYSGRWVSAPEISLTALLDTTRQLELCVEVGELHETVRDLKFSCYINGKLHPWVRVADGAFATIVHRPETLDPTSIKLKVTSLKRAAEGYKAAPIFRLKQITVKPV